VTDKSQSSRYVNADAPGGTGTFRQTLSGVYPGKTYQFSAFFALSQDFNPGPKGDTKITVSLDGVPFLTNFVACSPSAPCNLPGPDSGVPYGKVRPINVMPTSPTPVLEFLFNTVVIAGTENLDLFIDRVFLVKV
jgi:hypothetical protein